MTFQQSQGAYSRPTAEDVSTSQPRWGAADQAAADPIGHLRDMADLAQLQTQQFLSHWSGRLPRYGQALADLLPRLGGPAAAGQLAEYVQDFAQRSVLFLDTLRRRGNQFIEHEEKGCPPVLAFDYEVVVDGATLERPVNYSLVRIKPPARTEIKSKPGARPYIIIDPRAGHGAGIGGFKSESEVGIALAEGHPVYFCTFAVHPVPGQTVADVCRAEALFVREVRKLHPDADKPVVVGNCQGGWAAMLLAATNPDLTGPLVINGAPLSYWAGQRGKNPLRYLGGLTGGIVPALLAADLGNGEFDGANLVQNFENLNPANAKWLKYYEVFAKGDREASRYLDFERWWSGFYFMSEAEITWILENLFIGNKLAHGGAYLDRNLHADLRNVRAPIIVFASHGDNITPVPQALGWIADMYSSVKEIKARGQRIIYTVHDSIGHLGIFVASSVANREHKEIGSTLKTIEAMAPGLYEMRIVDQAGEGMSRRYAVDFQERSIEDVLALGDDRSTERPFAAAAQLSEINARIYNLTVRPLIKSMVSRTSAKFIADTQPLRVRRTLLSDRNPMMAPVAELADQVRAARSPAAQDNPFLAAERLMAEAVADGWNFYRDCRDAMVESWMYWVYGSPLMQALAAGQPPRVSEVPGQDPRTSPEVHLALQKAEQGGFADAVVRMLILLAGARQNVRRDRLERSKRLLTETEPFAAIGAPEREAMIYRQTVLVDFEPARALSGLPRLLPSPAERRRAMELCERVAGPVEEMDERTIAMFATLRTLLELPAAPQDQAAALA